MRPTRIYLSIKPAIIRCQVIASHPQLVYNVFMHDYKETLRKNGLKATSGRIKLLELLSKAKHPVSIKEIVKAIGSRLLDEATIYRSLESFKEKELIRRVDFRRGYTYYELADDDHHHLVCKNCGRIEDFEGCQDLIKKTLKQSKYFSQINEHSLELFGLCKQCI